jgi:hypothetical protein
MKTYYTEYLGYLNESFAGVTLPDMSLQVEHFWSGGALDPIVSIGLAPRFTAHEIEVPLWLVDGLGVNSNEPSTLAVRVAAGYYDEVELFRALRYLTIGKPGKFYRSLIEQFSKTGTLSPKQVTSVLYPPKFNRY